MTEIGSIYDRQAYQDTGASRNGGKAAIGITDFAQSTGAQINSYSQGSAAGSYAVQRSGETLRSVAEQLWGDASLWYRIADASAGIGNVSPTTPPAAARERVRRVGPQCVRPRRNL